MADRKSDHLYTSDKHSSAKKQHSKRAFSPDPSNIVYVVKPDAGGGRVSPKRKHSPSQRQTSPNPRQRGAEPRISPVPRQRTSPAPRQRTSPIPHQVFTSVHDGRHYAPYSDHTSHAPKPIYVQENHPFPQSGPVSAMQQMQRKYSPIPFSGYMEGEPKVLLDRLEVSIPHDGRMPPSFDLKLSPGSLRRFSPSQKLSSQSGMSPYEMSLSPALQLTEGRPSPIPVASVSPMSMHMERRPSPAHMPERISPMPIMMGSVCTPPPAHGAHQRPHKSSPSVFVDSSEDRKPSPVPPSFGVDTHLLSSQVQRSSLSPSSLSGMDKSRLSPISGQIERKLSPTPRKAHLLRAVPESERRSPSRNVDLIDRKYSPLGGILERQISPKPGPPMPNDPHHRYDIGLSHISPTLYRQSHSPARPSDQLPEGVRIHISPSSFHAHGPMVSLSPSHVTEVLSQVPALPTGGHLGEERRLEYPHPHPHPGRAIHLQTPAYPHMVNRVPPVPGKPLLSAHLGGAPFVPQGVLSGDSQTRPTLISQGLIMHPHLSGQPPITHPYPHKGGLLSSGHIENAGMVNEPMPSHLLAQQVSRPPHHFIRKAFSDMTPFHTTRKPTDDYDGEGMPRLTHEGLWPDLRELQRGLIQQPAGILPKVHTTPDVELKPMGNPFSKRVQILNNFPTNSTAYRSPYRSQSVAMHRAKCCCITSAAKSLDILRQNLQKSMNKEIDEIIQKYMQKYFQPGIENIKLNNGQTAVSEEHIHAVSRQILEEAKKMYVSERPRSSTPVRDIPDNVSDSGSTSGSRIRIPSRRRRASDTDSEISIPVKKKRKGRPPLNTSGRGTPSKTFKSHSPVRREGPKWDVERLTTEALFVMGARANKALGLGATRGRLYIKHPDIFKYSGDQDDKQWLFDNHHMPATGGKAYMLLVEDIRDLAAGDEYRDSPNLLLDEILGFSVPAFMIEKMKVQMTSLRTDGPKPKTPSRSRSGTPDSRSGVGPVARDNKLPFSAFSSPTNKHGGLDIKTEPSPSNTEEMDLMSTGDNEEQNQVDMSPLHMGSGFDDVNSDLDTLDEAPFLPHWKKDSL